MLSDLENNVIASVLLVFSLSFFTWITQFYFGRYSNPRFVPRRYSHTLYIRLHNEHCGIVRANFGRRHACRWFYRVCGYADKLMKQNKTPKEAFKIAFKNGMANNIINRNNTCGIPTSLILG